MNQLEQSERCQQELQNELHIQKVTPCISVHILKYTKNIQLIVQSGPIPNNLDIKVLTKYVDICSF